MKQIELGNVLMQKSPTQKEAVILSSKDYQETSFADDRQFNSIMQQIQKNNNSKNLFKNEESKHPSEKTSTIDGDQVDELPSNLVIKDSSENLNSDDLGIAFQSLIQLIVEHNLFAKDIKQILNGEIDVNHLFSLDDLDVEAMASMLNEHDLEMLKDLLGQMATVLQQIKELVNKPFTAEQLSQVAKNIHKLLNLWQELSKETEQRLMRNDLMFNEEDESLELLRQLITTYQKRSTFAKRNIYQANSSITVEDVQSWLQQSLEKYATGNIEQNTFTVTNEQPIQMSPLQQYTLHVSETDRVDAISRNLVSDLNHIINRSNFLRQPGLEQLTITLKPQSLGDVTIRLAQVNGEMTVKFLITTQAARELFESNLHHLKPMFSPNHVVVERDATIADEEFFHEEQEQLNEDHEDSNNEHEGQQEDSAESEVSFEDLLQLLSKEASSEYA